MKFADEPFLEEGLVRSESSLQRLEVKKKSSVLQRRTFYSLFLLLIASVAIGAYFLLPILHGGKSSLSPHNSNPNDTPQPTQHYSQTMDEFFLLVGAKINQTPENLQPYVDTLAANWFTTVDQLSVVTDDDFDRMKFPIALVDGIHAVFDDLTCTMACKHGGVVNANCTACDSCLGAWSGTLCDKWDATTTTQDQLLSSMNAQADASLANIEAQKKYNPLPGSVGFGVDLTTGARKLPVTKLTYNDADQRVWTDAHGDTFSLPTEATFDPLPGGFQSPTTKSWAFKSMLDYLNNIFEESNVETGYGGFFAEFTDLQAFFDANFKGDFGLTVTQQYYLLHKLGLPFDPTTKAALFELDPQCLAALNSLPPDYTSDDNKALYRLFVQYWGTSLAVESTNGGSLESRMSFDKTLVSEDGMSEDDIAKDANIVMLATLGLSTDVPPASFTAKASPHASACYGANPEQCDTSFADLSTWMNWVDSNPVSLYYSIKDISALVEDENTRINIQLAINGYVQDQLDQFNAMNTCPTCLQGTCASPSEVCTCTNAKYRGVKCDQCITGWSGPDTGCNTPVCSAGCVHGTCTGVDTCECFNFWGGDNCNFCLMVPSPCPTSP